MRGILKRRGAALDVHVKNVDVSRHGGRRPGSLDTHPLRGVREADLAKQVNPECVLQGACNGSGELAWS